MNVFHLRLDLRLGKDERGAFLWRYALIIAVFAIGCFAAFTTVGEEAVNRIWALGERIAQA